MPIRVLLVDDEVELRDLWREVLEDRGHAVTAVGSVAQVRQLVTDGLEVDVAVVDWTLPDGRGSDVRATLRAGRIDCPVVFASGLGPMLPPDHGGAKVLSKPFRVRALLDTVTEFASEG